MNENNKKNNITREEEYQIYISKIYRVIPKNHALIVRNKFIGNRVDVKTGGFALISPFHESKLVSLAVRNFDYSKQVFEDKEGQDIIIDLAITVKIVDPVKYEYLNEDTEKELRQLLESIMRALIKKYSYEELRGQRFSLPDSSMNASALTGIQKDLYDIRIELDSFANKYGLAVENLYNKSIQQTEKLQEAYNKRIIAEKEAEAEEIKKLAELKRAKIAAEILDIEATAKAEAKTKEYKAKYGALLEAISSLPKTKQAEILKAFTAGLEGNANLFMSLNGDNNVNPGIVVPTESKKPRK